MSVSYELRSARGNRLVCVFDDLARAKQRRQRAEASGVNLTLFKVTRLEESIS